jgi:hypothetical protein
MHARLSMIFSEKDNVDAGLAYIEDSARGAIEGTPGSKGLATLVDWETGVIITVSYWDASPRSAEVPLTQAQAPCGALTIEIFEVMVGRQVRKPLPGAAVRLARTQIDRTRRADIVEFYREDVVPRLEHRTGLCSAELLIDHDSGTALSVTVWEDAAATTRAEDAFEQLRVDAEQHHGVKLTWIESYTMVHTSARIDWSYPDSR